MALWCVNGDLFQEGLCHTQVCCTQSPCPCSSPLLICTSSRDTQTQSWLSLCGVSGSWYTSGLFEPSEHLWRVWGLILNVIMPLSFALGHGVSPQSCSITMQPPRQCQRISKGNARECSNYRTIALISHASKVMLKILQARLQQYMNCEFPDVQAGFRKGRGTEIK